MQTILNSYIYWQILELVKKVKFSVVIRRDNSVNGLLRLHMKNSLIFL